MDFSCIFSCDNWFLMLILILHFRPISFQWMRWRWTILVNLQWASIFPEVSSQRSCAATYTCKYIPLFKYHNNQNILQFSNNYFSHEEIISLHINCNFLSTTSSWKKILPRDWEQKDARMEMFLNNRFFVILISLN